MVNADSLGLHCDYPGQKVEYRYIWVTDLAHNYKNVSEEPVGKVVAGGVLATENQAGVKQVKRKIWPPVKECSTLKKNVIWIRLNLNNMGGHMEIWILDPTGDGVDKDRQKSVPQVTGDLSKGDIDRNRTEVHGNRKLLVKGVLVMGLRM